MEKKGKKEGEFSKKVEKLKGLKKQVYELLKRNPTTKYVIEKTGKRPSSVGKAIKKLIDLGYIERLENGVYKIFQKPWVQTRVFQNESKKREREAQGLKNEDYLRLHKLEVELKVNSEIHRMVKNTVFKRKNFRNIRGSGTNKGMYFDAGNITYMVTNRSLFAIFPEGWELEAENITELGKKLYNEILREIDIIEKRFNIPCFKDGKINFDIRNMHIALVRNGVVKEFRKNDINDLVVYDEKDGKPRFIMDLSKGLPELEAIHPNKGIGDADEAQYFMDRLKDGDVREVIKNSKTFFDSSDISTDTLKRLIYGLANNLDHIYKLNKAQKDKINFLMESQVRTQNQLETTSTNLTEVTNVMKNSKNKGDKPDYIM